LAELGDTKEDVRSALIRASRKSGRDVATATDENFLYVWNMAKLAGLNETRRYSQANYPETTARPDRLPIQFHSERICRALFVQY
jgi:hypothetical protein